MRDIKLSRHAEMRLRQRGFRNVDVEVVLLAATHLSGDAFFLSDQDVQREIAVRKREIQQFERLRGAEMIVEGGVLVTAYHRAGKVESQHRRSVED